MTSVRAYLITVAVLAVASGAPRATPPSRRRHDSGLHPDIAVLDAASAATHRDPAGHTLHPPPPTSLPVDDVTPPVDVATTSYEASDVDNAPNVDEVSDVDNAPNVDEVSDVDNAPNVDEVSDVDNAPNVDEVSDVDVAPIVGKKSTVDVTSDGKLMGSSEDDKNSTALPPGISSTRCTADSAAHTSLQATAAEVQDDPTPAEPYIETPFTTEAESANSETATGEEIPPTTTPTTTREYHSPRSPSPAAFFVDDP